MVNNPTWKGPIFDIAMVREVAAAGYISYAGRKVTRDVANLGYDLRDVKACLEALAAKDFIGSVDYPTGASTKLSCDAYCVAYCSARNEKADTIYLKFHITQVTHKTTRKLMVCSFHLSR